jgi:hypothetical protein
LGLTQADANVARELLETAWNAIVHIGTNLHDNGQPVLPLAGGGAGVAAPPAAPAFAGLLGLLGGLGHGAVAGGAAAVAAPYNLTNEKGSFFAFIQQEHEKRAEDKQSASTWYRRNMDRIPKIAAM